MRESNGFLMALDVGGGSGRCLLVEPGGGNLFTARREWSHPTAPNTNGLGYDLDLIDIWHKLGEACREAIEKANAAPADILSVAVTSMRNTTVVIDPGGEILLATPNQDARALGESLTLGAERGPAVHEAGGHWPSPLFLGSRLLWMKNNAPDLLERASHALSLSDWVAFKMGAGLFAERSQAGETLLFDLRRRDWNFDLVSELGLKASLFPETVDAGTPIGRVSDQAAGHLGLLAGTPIAAGGPDTQCGLLGAGAVKDGEIGLVSGTTMPIQMVTDDLVLDGEGRLWSGLHVVPGRYVIESNGLTAGYVLEWFAKLMFYDYQFPLEVVFGEAARSTPGGEGVYSTFGANVFDARTIGIPVGNITMSHMVTTDTAAGRRHVSRALVEGIAYSARANIEQILAVRPGEPAELRVFGGLTQSPLWPQMVSDVVGLPARVPSHCEVTSLGAAACAGFGAGVYKDLEAGASQLACDLTDYRPSGASAKYQSLYAGWKEAHDMRAACDQHVSGLVTMALLEHAPLEAAAAPPGLRPGILVTASIDDVALAELGELGEVSYAPWRKTGKVYDGGPELAEALRGVDVFVTEMDVVDFEVLRDSPGLRAIVSCRGNPVNVDLEAATGFGVPFIYTPGRNADAVADLAIAMMVMLARKLLSGASFLKDEGIKAGDLEAMGRAYIEYQGRELWRKTVGIVGMGNVGVAVARRARGFGASVVFFDPEVSLEDGALLNARKVSFEDLLAQSDFVTVHAPANDRTKNMFDAVAFAAMKEGAFFINTARASLADEAALTDALESGHLAGAGLDVFSTEPPASDSPLVSLKNVITTPHIGGDTLEISAHQGALVTGQLHQLMRGVAPDHILNPSVMESFAWSGARPTPSPSEMGRLAERPRPSMTS
ncbi:MAG TPA: NAD(P)-dependent oxidoreductase [Candidatus Anoxymicrobiaceae bacterium]